MTDPQFAALTTYLIDLNSFQERTADALERIAGTLEEQNDRLAGKIEVPMPD